MQNERAVELMSTSPSPSVGGSGEEAGLPPAKELSESPAVGRSLRKASKISKARVVWRTRRADHSRGRAMLDEQTNKRTRTTLTQLTTSGGKPAHWK